MRRAFLGVLMGLLCAASCVASARTSLFPAVGARSNGMGSMSTTLRGDGAALFGNPSLMADVSKSTLSVDTTQSALAATVPFGKYGSVGVGMADLADHDRFLFNQSWNPIGTFETDRNRLSVGYAARLHSQLSIGATYDGWRSYNDTWSTGWSAGLLVRPTDVLHIGVEAHQVGDELRPRFGALLRPNRKMQFRMELERRDLAFGVESSWKYMTLRGGLQFEKTTSSHTLGSMGASGHLGRGVVLHYGYEFNTNDLQAGTHRVTVDVPLAHLTGSGSARSERPRPSSLSATAPPPKSSTRIERASPPTQPKTQPVVSAPKETPLPTVATPIAETPSQTADESVVQARRAVPVLSSESFTLASIRDRQPGRLAPVEEPDLTPAYVEPEPIVSIPSVPPRTTSPKRVITSAVDKQPDIPSNLNRNLRGLIEHHANKYGVEVELILAMMRTESAFNPHAISTSKAVGLFQLLPGAAGDMGIEISGGDLLDKNRDGRFDPIRNADAGIRYLAHLLQRFDWNYALAIAAYNAGPGRVTDDIPQRRETERHVGKVLNYYFQYRNDANTLASAWQRIESISVN